MANPSPRVVRRPDVETRPLADGAILVNMKTGHCFRLNRVGAEAWALLGSPRSLTELCDAISSRYGISKDRADADLTQLLAQLKEHELVDGYDR